MKVEILNIKPSRFIHEEEEIHLIINDLFGLRKQEKKFIRSKNGLWRGANRVHVVNINLIEKLDNSYQEFMEMNSEVQEN